MFKEKPMLATGTGYEFEVDRGPDWLWIRVRRAPSASWRGVSLAEEIQELVERHFVYRIVLDLERLPKLSGNMVLSSKLIGELVQVNQHIRAHDGVLRICGLSPENRAMLEVCGLEDLCLAYHTREEAICGSCGPRLPR
jgi:anti-anti-sigma regulatory factor